MQFFYWNKSFEVGISEIDQQHRKLVDMINELAAAIVEGARLPDVQELINRLTEYSEMHFNGEEKIIFASSLDEEEKLRHQNAHRCFVEKAHSLASRTDLQQDDTSQQILEFLTTWLISHILGSDMKYVQALKQGEEIAGHAEQLLVEISPVERMLLGALTETERRFRLISDHTPVLIWVADVSGTRGFFNRAWNIFVSAKEDQDQNLSWTELIHPDDREEYLAKISYVLSDPKPVEAEYRLRHYGGNYHWFLEKILPRIDSYGTLLGFIASATDISNLKQAEELISQSSMDLEKQVASRTEQLEQLMLTDPLTGAGNRRMLMKRLEEEVLRAHRYQRPLTLAFFDVDHFKKINDTFGHAVGDLVLTGVVESLKSGLRDCDLLGRFGGEEFVVLLPETGIEKAAQVAERMRMDIEELKLSQIEGSITISAGLATLRSDENGDDLLVRSDRALYRAKDGGRNCCCIDR